MAIVVIVLGVLAELVAWRVVVRAGRSVWVVMGGTLAVVGLAASLARHPTLSPKVPVALAAAVGVALGVALYAATRLFVRAVAWWTAFVRQSGEIYARRGSLSIRSAVLAVAILVIGEELFWRGLVQPRLSAEGGAGLGAALTWGLYVLANLTSASLPIIAGAVVGGAVWVALGAWTHGILASLACHGCWTALMLSYPVVEAPDRP